MTRRTAQQLRDAVNQQTPAAGNEPCRGKTSLFYPPRGARTTATNQLIQQARNICRACPHQPACLEGALARSETNGVWGGVNFNTTSSRNGETSSTRRWRIIVETLEIRRWREQDTDTA